MRTVHLEVLTGRGRSAADIGEDLVASCMQIGPDAGPDANDGRHIGLMYEGSRLICFAQDYEVNRLTARFQPKIRMAAVMVFLLTLGMAISGMATMAAAENFALGDIPLDKETYEKYIKEVPPDRLEAVHPTSYDARTAGIVTSAKNQEGCGSCWAFASVGAFESHILKKYASGPYDLSEQQLLDCNTMGYDCTGGSSDAARYWESTGPITETCYPYTATKGSCSYSCSEMSYRVTGWHTVTQSEWYFKDSCYNDGPSYWRFQVYSDFENGSGGGWWYDAGPGDVYVNAGGTIDRGGHAVLLIGWDDAKGAYLCKNSWGATGGPNGDGTFWIAYSGHGNDLLFGMANFDITVGSVTTTTTTTPTTTTTTTTLPPCPDCPSNGVITNATYHGGTTCSCSNATAITLGPDVLIENEATVTFTAPIITVQPGFHAESGAVVNMKQP